jgi:hypothetical protein
MRESFGRARQMDSTRQASASTTSLGSVCNQQLCPDPHFMMVIQIFSLQDQHMCRFGYRSHTLQLLQEWVQTIASQTGEVQGASISIGSIGAPECQLQVDLEFAELSSVDRFWRALPVDEHKAWIQRLQVL